MGSFGVRTRIVIITCGKPTAFDCENDSGIFEDTDLSIPDIQNPYGLTRVILKMFHLFCLIAQQIFSNIYIDMFVTDKRIGN